MTRFSLVSGRTRVVIALTAALVAAACSNPRESVTPAVSPSSALQGASQPSANPAAADPGIVGTWERETTCEELVSELTDAGLEQWVLEGVAGNGFVPGVRIPEQIADASNPCDGAVPRTHSHFFTDDGQFGSLDWNGDPVDDGTYEVVDTDTLVVSKEFPDVTFDFSIDFDTLSLEPVIPDCSPDCFEAAWSVSVAYPGETWQRVDEAAALVDPLVGEWARTLECSELAAAYADAGLQAYMQEMIWGAFFWPQVQSAGELDFDPKDPCKGAEPRLHSHFFTADGAFGSRDEKGEEVDNGTYQIVRENRLVINDVMFRYRIRGDAITFDPVTPECTPCFAHAWGVAVASPGGEWDRVG